MPARAGEPPPSAQVSPAATRPAAAGETNRPALPPEASVIAGAGRFGALSAAVQASVRRFADNAVPIDTRQAELAALAKSGGTDAAAVLMALGDEHTYLNSAAIEALGGVKAEGVAAYLTGKMTDGDPRVLAAAVKSLARQQGETAVPAIATVVRNNRQRPDGFQDMVCAACVQALGETRSARAIPVLDAELRETVGTTLHQDYGSEIVRALSALHLAEARPVLSAYADRMSQTLPLYDSNPLGKRYIEGKINEARAAAASLGN